MPWLMIISIADIPGPQFLVIFWAVAAALIAAVSLGVRRLDPSIGLDPLPFEFMLNAQDLACLRDGGRGLLLTTLFDLWRRGYLGIVEPKEGPRQMVRAEDGPDPSSLDEYEREILDEFATPRELTGLHRVATLMALAERRSSDLEPSLRDELLLMPSEPRSRARTVGWLVVMSLLLLSGYKLSVAMSNGHYNVGVLIVSTVMAAGGVAAAATLPRQTRRGSDYLDRLRVTLGGWADRIREEPGIAVSPSAVEAVAVLGYSALAGTPQGSNWQSIGTVLDPSTGHGGCGGGGDGGGGCGGGCGGCGG